MILKQIKCTNCGAPIRIQRTLGGLQYKENTCSCHRRSNVPVALRPLKSKRIK